MPSDEELSDWEKDQTDSEPEAPPPKAVATPDKLSAKKGLAASLHKQLQTPLDDPDAERERIKLMQEARDISLGGAMFGVDEDDEELRARSEALLATAKKLSAGKKDGSIEMISPADAVKHITVDRLADVEALCDALDVKISASKARSATWLRLMDRLLVACSGKMEPQDLKTLSRKVGDAERNAQRAKNLAATTAKKGTDLKVNLKNVQAEVDMMYGDYADDDSESELDDDASDFDGNGSNFGEDRPVARQSPAANRPKPAGSNPSSGRSPADVDFM